MFYLRTIIFTSSAIFFFCLYLFDLVLLNELFLPRLYTAIDLGLKDGRLGFVTRKIIFMRLARRFNENPLRYSCTHGCLEGLILL